jgi:nucleoside-diphosphate-sugar epimerase
MATKKVFITGASGCIGHYLIEHLIQETDWELYLLIRNPEQLKFERSATARVRILQGDMQQIDRHRQLLSESINIAILAATAWGGAAESYEVNVNKTIQLIDYLNPDICQKIIYFSTASILDRNNQLLPEALSLGTDYIRTKYQCFANLSGLKIADKITAVFPTLVVGGDQDKPYSHISEGLPDVTKWIKLIRWFRADGSFHFIHAKDIAAAVYCLIEKGQILKEKIKEDRDSIIGKSEVEKIILGNPSLTVNRAIQQICNYFNLKIYWQIPLSIVLANFFIKAFRIQMDDWSWFSLQYRHFTYQNPVTPATFGADNYCSTLADVLKARGI